MYFKVGDFRELALFYKYHIIKKNQQCFLTFNVTEVIRKEGKEKQTDTQAGRIGWRQEGQRKKEERKRKKNKIKVRERERRKERKIIKEGRK